MRVRVQIDVHVPLKRRKKITVSSSRQVYKINPILGFNLEGNQFQNDCHKERGGDSGENDLMEEDLEEDPIKNIDREKRRVFQTVSHVPKPLDSVEHADERKNASQLSISMTTIGQASRKQ
ncbi:hypothetical protein Goari_011555 [Gossypium aridum]|uniref:Uncharacterized protein n=1 Tax=Gossypium aridum TaxID=34290 RepID=A0A7J8WXQ5_GOSAI|nr:hypothetical protein [Gossypium aridum]